MSDEMIIQHCAPTLAGLKTGNLFGCRYKDAKALRDAVRRYNNLLSAKGLRVLPLKYDGNRALIYLYRPSRLREDLYDQTALSVLRECGYCVETPAQCIIQLMRRMSADMEFPHEIGLFLGYPPEDVNGFIKNRGSGCKCVGCWKVYGDAEKARRTFDKFKKCTEIYGKLYRQGRSIERLTVAG